MPTSGWKLSAALICAAFSSQVFADEQKSTFAAAMNCSIIAATVYAELSTETAQSVSLLAQAKCADEWKAAEAASVDAAIASTEITIGRELTPDELRSFDRRPVYPSMVSNEIALRVANWRARSLLSGHEVYSTIRQEYLAKSVPLHPLDSK